MRWVMDGLFISVCGTASFRELVRAGGVWRVL